MNIIQDKISRIEFLIKHSIDLMPVCHQIILDISQLLEWEEGWFYLPNTIFSWSRQHDKLTKFSYHSTDTSPFNTICQYLPVPEEPIGWSEFELQLPNQSESKLCQFTSIQDPISHQISAFLIYPHSQAEQGECSEEVRQLLLEYLKKVSSPLHHMIRGLPDPTETIPIYLDYSPDPFFMTNPEGKIILTNECWKKYGFPYAHLDDLSPSKDFPLNLQLYWEEKDVWMNWLIVFDHRYYLGFGRDITQFKKTEEHLQRTFEEKNQYLSRISHELRTPLNSILGFAQLVKYDPNLVPNTQENVDMILDSGHFLLSLVNDVLDISQIESRRMQFSSEPFLLYEVVEESISVIYPQASTAKINLNVGELNRQTICTSDRNRLKQILVNLLSNAVKYNRPNGQVEIWMDYSQQYENHVAIYIKDTGVGISESDLPHLFEPFNRLHAEKSTIPGSGLGLALSKSLADHLEVKIGVESLVGVGSTFSVHLGFEEELMTADPEPSLEVVCIEDNPANQLLMQKLIEDFFPKVHLKISSYGETGLQYMQETLPCLLLLDLNLPDIYGLEIVSKMKEDPQLRQIPVYIMSADANKDTIEKAYALGVDDYITKPFDIEALMKKLGKYLS